MLINCMRQALLRVNLARRAETGREEGVPGACCSMQGRRRSLGEFSWSESRFMAAVVVAAPPVVPVAALPLLGLDASTAKPVAAAAVALCVRLNSLRSTKRAAQIFGHRSGRQARRWQQALHPRRCPARS